MSDFQLFIDAIKSDSDEEIGKRFKLEFLEQKDKDSWRPLHHASLNGRVGLVKLLLSKNCEINSRINNGCQPIHLACWNGHIDIVKILIANKCDINAFDKWKYQPIHVACKNGNIDIVKILIANKCDINASDNNGCQPIHFACMNGHIDVVKILIANKCNINASDKNGYKPIHLACQNGHIVLLKLLIAKKCNINAFQENYGYQPIHYAIKNGNTAIVKTLIENKCDINAYDRLGYQPIHLACENDHIDTVKMLIAKKCNINAFQKNNGCHPIHLACVNGHTDIMKLLVENKCDINASDHLGNQPIHLACEKGHTDIVKILIERKCDINAYNCFGCQPIHSACENGHVSIVKMLMTNVNVTEKFYGYQPIHVACMNGQFEIVKMLIESKCDINASDNNGHQPIHFACTIGNIDIVKILIANNCDINVLSIHGKSPIDVAKMNEHQQIIDILINANLIESVVTAIDLHCVLGCDHRFCRRSVENEIFMKGELIGSGTFGKVYNYKISNTNREIVIKRLKYVCEDKKNIEQNINKFLSRILHRNIVRYFGALEKSGKLCIFMEFMSGGSLKVLIDKSGWIEHSKVIKFCKELLDGLQFIHSNGIIHRDVKPENILLDHDETLKLTDFGLSKSLRIASISETIEKAKTFCGTINYSAPEIFLSEPYDFPADIWSAGASIIHMITGKKPYHWLRAEAVMFKIATTKKIEFTPCQPISETMQLFIDDLLTPEQSQRPSAEFLLKHSIFIETKSIEISHNFDIQQ